MYFKTNRMLACESLICVPTVLLHFHPSSKRVCQTLKRRPPQRRSPLLLQMQNLGIISNLVNGLSSPELLLPSPVRPQWSLMNDYDLLFCLRRDSNKVQSYLKILKCRIVPENDCWSPKERETAHSQTPFANHFNDEWVTMPDQTLVERTWFSICTFRGSLRLLLNHLTIRVYTVYSSLWSLD